MQDDQDKTQGPDREASNSPLLPDPLPTFSFSFSTFTGIAAADLHRRIPCIPREMSMSLGQSGASGHHNLPGSVSMDMGVTKDVEALRGYVDNRFKVTNAKIAALDAKVDQGFARVDERFAQVDGAIKELAVQTNERFAQVDEQFAQVNVRLDRLENRIDNMDNHMQIMDNRMQIMDNNMHIMHNEIQTIHNRMQTMDTRISQLQASVETIIELLRASGTTLTPDIPTLDTTHAQASSLTAPGEGEAVISHHTAQIHHSADILSSMARGIVRAKSALSLKLKPSKSRT